LIHIDQILQLIVNGTLCGSFHEAAIGLGLAINDNEYKLMFEEYSKIKTGPALRSLFAELIMEIRSINGKQLLDQFYMVVNP